ncbi:TIGR03571 family LLM class oxidoreductase [Vibrio alginolyticus]|uniref:TIGR03571 family LLM class oxidoreductase n=1 Tax=Vibrio TaxID=662 RepID=UPI001EFD63E6|nr:MULTISPECIES: TIGR03571 family LLM class oxidoreductase [Vibrio]EHK9548534.1 TIGR03571 family LLM class oxidoreductase [Vibrio alginolyticus]EHK9605361.1 TIGR03571 family LLM class oxidoreductase [Vibrio alginolyticus]MCG9718737.1 TIGR03571 family LLM class oxidoreductase [Vibrio alginolyticus]MDW1872057.1 TIGR03571 family LLM class oxidoreductase [Vibrio sp. Vb0598]
MHKDLSNRFTIGVELPLDNDWTQEGQKKRLLQRKPFGVPDMSAHKQRIMLADKLGFNVAWVRDVPLYDPNFGDAAQIYEPFSYLGYLSACTDNILLGTAAIVLPLRQPWLVKKAAATINELSGDRLILGVASGDRPSEYPVFNANFDSRSSAFRESVEILKDTQNDKLGNDLQLLPEFADIPIYVAGLAQQSPQWIGENLDGWLAYPGTPDDHEHRVALWRSVAGNKPYASFIHLDLVDNPNAPVVRHHFGIQAGVNGLSDELEKMQEAGVNHIGLHFRRNSQPIEKSMEQIAQYVLPRFN